MSGEKTNAVSAQRHYQLKQMEKQRCPQCGMRNRSKKVRCSICRKKDRDFHRQKTMHLSLA